MLQIFLSITAVAGAVAYLLYLLLRRERSLSAVALFLILGCIAAVELFGLLFYLSQGQDMFWKQLSLTAEGLMVPLWLVFSLVYARSFQIAQISRLQWSLVLCSLLFPLLAIWHPIDLYVAPVETASEKYLFLTTPGFYFYLGILVFLIISLINLEATLREAQQSTRWKIKFDIIGAGLILAVFIVFYSQGLLYRALNMELAQVRSAMIILGILLMAYSGLKRGGDVKIKMSSRMAFNSVVLLAAGIYLIGIGLMGKGMNHLGIPFQDSLQLFLVLLSGLGFLVLFLSENIRRKIKVSLHKNFFENKYDYRTQWQEFTSCLVKARNRDSVYGAVIARFLSTFGMGWGAIYLKEQNNSDFACAHALAMDPGKTRFSLSDALVNYMTQRKWLVDVHQGCPDLTKEQKELFQNWKICFVIPFFLNGTLEGFVLLGNPANSAETYNYEDYDMMKSLASQGFSAIQNMRLAEELAAARDMEAAGRVSAFILHDLKNLGYALSLILDNAREYIDDPEFQKDMIESLTAAVEKMNMLVFQLKDLPGTPKLEKQNIDLMHVANEAKNQIRNQRIEIRGDQVMVEANEKELNKVMINLLVNALEADQTGGSVFMEIGTNDREPFFRVRDYGCGMSKEFLKDAFSPFMSTKNKGLGIGLYHCKRIVDVHGGRIEVDSRKDQGSVFTVWLP